MVALLQNNGTSEDPRAPAPCTRPPPPPPRMSTWEPIDDRKPRKPSSQEMDIFERQEMSKSRPQVKSKLNKWYDWLINHVPKPIKMVQVKHLKLLRIRLWGCIIGLLVLLVMKRELKNPNHLPIELEQAFGGAYRSYRVNGRPKIDVDTFFNRIRKELIELIKRELKT